MTTKQILLVEELFHTMHIIYLWRRSLTFSIEFSYEFFPLLQNKIGKDLIVILYIKSYFYDPSKISWDRVPRSMIKNDAEIKQES